jgi:hypothetical protein
LNKLRQASDDAWAAAESEKWLSHATDLASSGLGAAAKFLAPELSQAKKTLGSIDSNWPPMIGLPSSQRFTPQEMKRQRQKSVETKTLADRARTYDSRRKPGGYDLPHFSRAKRQAIETKTLENRARTYHARRATSAADKMMQELNDVQKKINEAKGAYE